MFPGLRHLTVCGRDHNDGTIHLCSTRNHVFDICGMPCKDTEEKILDATYNQRGPGSQCDRNDECPFRIQHERS